MQIAFRKRLESFNYDMEAWRSWFLRRHAKDAAEGFEVLNLDNGIMWDLCKYVYWAVVLHPCLGTSAIELPSPHHTEDGCHGTDSA